eukprot:TRINITY_DN8203_c0_g1_i3.p1 TRINITY_DN8203_c0_g1~~TRINITY_DN8203_c0_g1_i3.p1  ORF type:complete len:223 (-),score=56.17 TRINITY_DN8203_c0_g1_i3:213-881(-)
MQNGIKDENKLQSQQPIANKQQVQQLQQQLHFQLRNQQAGLSSLSPHLSIYNNNNIITNTSGNDQQILSSNYTSACQWAAQQQQQIPNQSVKFPEQMEIPIVGDNNKISANEIQSVQNHIERCLKLYMNQNEVITALSVHANIPPGFTSLVWHKLEEQNPEFFKAYQVRLRAKEQITAFNFLVSQQFQALEKSNPGYFQTGPPPPNNNPIIPTNSLGGFVPI